LNKAATGKNVNAWVQEQHDLLCSNPDLRSKYCLAMGIKADILTPRLMGNIIRGMAHEAAFKDIPDSEFQ